MTEYVVLQSDDAGRWSEIYRVRERSSRGAIRLAAGKIEEVGSFVAVPARSWQPVKVQIETALKFS